MDSVCRGRKNLTDVLCILDITVLVNICDLLFISKGEFINRAQLKCCNNTILSQIMKSYKQIVNIFKDKYFTCDA